MLEMNKHTKKDETANGLSGLSYTHCLNCGTKLKGRFCYKCGQEAVNKTPTVVDFILEYLNHAFIWDPRFFSTFWTLIRRPGHLTNEFDAGKFFSYEHPLKLNMFLLFIFVTLFVFFASADKMTDSMHRLTDDERVFAGIQLQTLMDDPEYSKKMQESPRDTILLQAPLFLADNYPQVISNIDTKENTGGEALDKWVAVLPRVLVEDKIVEIDNSGYYRFNAENKIGNKDLELFHSVWAEMMRITSQYFPMLLLLTVPFLSFSLRFVQRKSKIPGINHFIFALHYTAFLEALIIFVYILYLAFAAPMTVLECFVMISSCIYLAVAFRRVYTSSWPKAVVKSLLTSLIYFIILLLLFIVIFFIACFIIAANMDLEV